MLHFDGFEDFEDYLGPRWHCYLSDAIATIPMPLRFAKGDFESGLASRLLNEYAADPYPYLDEHGKKKMDMAQSDLLRKFGQLALDESAETRYVEFSQNNRRQSVENDKSLDANDLPRLLL